MRTKKPGPSEPLHDDLFWKPKMHGFLGESCIYVGYLGEVDGYWPDSDAWPTHGRGHI